MIELDEDHFDVKLQALKYNAKQWARRRAIGLALFMLGLACIALSIMIGR
jgi:hypothetical protein